MCRRARIRSPQGDEHVVTEWRHGHDVRRSTQFVELLGDLERMGINDDAVIADTIDQPELVAIGRQPGAVRVDAAAVLLITDGERFGIHDIPMALVIRAPGEQHVAAVGRRHRAAIHRQFFRSDHVVELEGLGIEHDQAAIADARAQRDEGMGAVGAVFMADRARVFHLVRLLLEPRVVRDDQRTAQTGAETLGIQVGRDLDDLAITIFIRRTDDIDNDGAVVRRERCHVRARAGFDDIHHPAILGTDDGDVTGAGAGDGCVFVRAVERDHVRRLYAVLTDIDGVDQLMMLVIDVDHVGALVERPDFVAGRIVRRFHGGQSMPGHDRQADKQGQPDQAAGESAPRGLVCGMNHDPSSG